MTGLVHRILGLPGWLVLLIAGLVVFTEDALFVGFVVPGETVALLAGAAAKLGHVSLIGVLIVVIVAAIVGDSVGYEIERTAGQRVLRLHVLDKRRERLDEAQQFLARKGGSAVFLGPVRRLLPRCHAVPRWNRPHAVPEIHRLRCGWRPRLGCRGRAARLCRRGLVRQGREDVRTDRRLRRARDRRGGRHRVAGAASTAPPCAPTPCTSTDRARPTGAIGDHQGSARRVL